MITILTKTIVIMIFLWLSSPILKKVWALNNFSFPSFPKSEQTPALLDWVECASGAQAFNGFGLSSEALPWQCCWIFWEVPQSKPWCFSSVWPVVHHTERSPECLTCLVPLSTALSSELLRRYWPFTTKSNLPPEDHRSPGGSAGLKIDVVFLMLNLSYVVNSLKKVLSVMYTTVCFIV